ncbi:MAG: hypothetical protein K8T91_00930 [Planctomycetes bacterium]|nr:hypothetical protein [Planctomycetota bacterium]
MAHAFTSSCNRIVHRGESTSAHRPRHFLTRLTAVAVVALTLTAAAHGSAAEADNAPGEVPSLKLVPQDASFYAAMLRGREQVEIVANSNFWKRLNETEFVKQMRVQVDVAKGQPGNPLSEFLSKLETPENQQALAVVREMFSDEIFFYGGPDLGDAYLLVNDTSNAARFSTVMQELHGTPPAGRQTEAMRATLDALNADLDRIKVPELVLAMRIKDKDAAEEQLRRIEAYARVLPEHMRELAPLRGKFKSAKVGDSQFLTLTIDDTVIPWQNIPFEQVAEKPGQYDKLRDKLKGLKVVVALGIHQGYVVLSVGKSTDHLAAWGKGPALADHPKLKVLSDKGKQRFTSASYISERLSQSTGFLPRDVDNMMSFGEKVLPAAKLSEEDQKQIMADARQLADEIKADMPKHDALVGFAYITPQGIESYQYDWSQNKLIDGSKTLPVLTHLGANPLLAFAMRAHHRPENYERMVKVLAKGRMYFEKYGLTRLDDRDKENYKVISDIAFPILTRLDKVNREMLLPALADGQIAMVVDAGLKAKKWHDKMPATGEETAIPMPALVLGVADAGLMDKALGEYRQIINDLITKVRPLAPGAPDIQIPPAEQKKVADGATIYYYPLADKIGLNKQLAPNSGLSEKFFVMSFSPRLTVSLLKSQPLAAAAEGPLAAVIDRPLAGAVVFDFPQLVDLTLPWVNEGVREYVRQMERAIEQNLGDPADGDGQADDKPLVDSPAILATLAQVKQVGELLKAMRGVTSATYIEGGAKVTHRQIRFQDVP